MQSNSISLENFEIRGLFNRKDVSLNLSYPENVDIFIGQNGIGKTTILNILYYTLSLNFLDLRKMPFTSIKITLSNNKNVVISREELFLAEGIPKRFNLSAIKDIEEYLGNNYVKRLNVIIANSDNIEGIDFFEEMANHPAIPNRLKRYLMKIIGENVVSSNVRILKELVDSMKIEEIFFFPTYRRIEEDIKKFRLDEKDLNKLPGDVIQFGMADVEERFLEIERVISKATNDTYANLTGEMISYLSLNQTISDERKKKIEDSGIVKIIISRLANKINNEVQQSVIKLFENRSNIYKKEYEPLVFFLCALIDKYEENMHMEEQIHAFKNVVNKYLVNKKVVYDTHNIKIYVIDNETEESIPLKLLSSGEKQIVSLYSKIYLSFANNFIVLFDEPELSLSIEWQESLIKDIMDSKKCKFLIAVTHSPFIFNNKFEDNARSMELFITNKALSAGGDEDYGE